MGASREFLLLPPPSLLEWSDKFVVDATDVRLNGFILPIPPVLMGVETGAALSGLMNTDGVLPLGEILELRTGRALKVKNSPTYLV
jgi:hypothetical protein